MGRKRTTDVDKPDSSPLYCRLKEIIRQKIISGELPAGARIASERDICETYGVSRITAIRTLSDLVSEGLIFREQGKGTFVADIAPDHNKTFTIGVGLHDPGYLMLPFFSCIIAGMTEVGGTEGYRVQLIATNGQRQGDEQSLYSRVLEQKEVDGLVVVDYVVSDSDLIDLKSHGLPIVLLERAVPGHDFCSVVLDNRGGAFQLVEHLSELGHRDIGFVAVSSLAHPPTRERYEGLRSALEVRGLEFHPEWIIVEHEAQKGQDILQPGLAGLISLKHRPTALICYDDAVALKTIYILRSLGFKVPQDMSITGFDNFPQSEHTVPRLTTVDSHLMDLGREAARMLIAQMRGEKLVRRRHVGPATIVIRDSVAPAPQ